MRRVHGWLAAVLVGLGLTTGTLLGAEVVMAHAVLLRSIPPSRQTLPQAPQEIRLLFSEPIDIVFSSIHVTDAAGGVVDLGDTHVDPSDSQQLVVSVRSGLADGIYTVAWRSLSTIDVHPDGGQYPLFVGVPVSAATSSAAATVTVASSTPETTLGRWWFYLASSVFGGVLASWKLVIGPLLSDGPSLALRRQVRSRAQRLVVLGGILLVIGTLFTAVAQAAAAAGVPLLGGVGQPLSDLLLRGRFAAIWWPRIGLETASLLLVVFGGIEGLAAECTLATLPAVLLTSSLTSHGAALPSLAVVGIAVDWLHILGATAWVGGLLGILVCVPVLAKNAETQDRVPRLIARFGRFALAASALVVLSGIVQAVFEIGSWSALFATSYGQLVLVKIALLTAMLLLAAFSRWSAPAMLRRRVSAELAAGIVVLAVAAVLTGVPPASR